MLASQNVSQRCAVLERTQVVSLVKKSFNVEQSLYSYPPNEKITAFDHYLTHFHVTCNNYRYFRFI